MTERREPPAASVLAALAEEAALFHARDGHQGFATIAVNGHLECWPVMSKGFRDWLECAYYHKAQKPPPTTAFNEALRSIDARARHEHPAREVRARIGGHDGRIYVDLIDDGWRVVEITANGWRVLDGPSPVAFTRFAGMEALPEPVRGGSLDTLRRLLNLGDDDAAWYLIAAWLTYAFKPEGPYPVLGMFGERGTAKTVTGEWVRSLIDPNVAPLRAEPRELLDLVIAARHGWVVGFDNLSTLPLTLSDALARLSTGSGFGTRALYTDTDEVLFKAERPVLVNGIEVVISQGDLMDRSVLVELPVIPEERRRTREALRDAFAAARPAMFGAVLDAVAGALRELPHVRLPRLPRMADFATWGVALERVLGWPPESFLRAYQKNMSEAHEIVLSASPLADPIRALVADGPWEGTPTHLLAELTARATATGQRPPRGWPNTTKALSGALKRLGPALRAVGIGMDRDFGRDRRKQRLVRLYPLGPREEPSDPSDASDGPPSSDTSDGSDASIPVFAGAPSDGSDGSDASRPPLKSDGGQYPPAGVPQGSHVPPPPRLPWGEV